MCTEPDPGPRSVSSLLSLGLSQQQPGYSWEGDLGLGSPLTLGSLFCCGFLTLSSSPHRQAANGPEPSSFRENRTFGIVFAQPAVPTASGWGGDLISPSFLQECR